LSDYPCGIRLKALFKGLEENSGISSIEADEQALYAEPIAAWQPGDGGHGLGCGEWLGPLFAKIQEKAAELDEVLLLAIRMLEAGRPGHRLRLLPLRTRRLTIAFEVSKLLEELEEVVAKW
jgi:hypothetical protein